MKGFLRDTGRLNGGEVTPEILDAAWVDFRNELRASDADDRAIAAAVNGIGLCFGQILVHALGMEWIIATDSHGREIAVRGTSGWVVYPRDVVRKRYATDESGFLTALFAAVRERS